MIKQYDISRIFEINDDLTFEKVSVDDLYYVIVDNVFRYPTEVKDFLLNFPAEDYSKNSQELRPLGIQQLLPSVYFQTLTWNIIPFLSEGNFIPVEDDLTRKDDPEAFLNTMQKISYYTNYIDKDTCSLNGNNIPHSDKFEYSFNFHLEESEVGGGLSFYKLKHEDQYFTSIKKILQQDVESVKSIQKTVNDYFLEKSKEGSKPLEPITNDDTFELFHTCEYKFNRLVLHQGNYWHSINYNATKEKNSRYSLVAAYTHNIDHANKKN